MTPHLKDHQTKLLLFLLGLSLIRGGIYAATTPPWQAPDEPWHSKCVEDIAGGKLRGLSSVGYHPPLYYLLAAPFAALTRYQDTVVRLHALRGFSVALATLTQEIGAWSSV